MKSFSKKIFRCGRYIIGLGVLALFVFISTQKVQAVAKDYPYLIKVNRYQNTITIYEKDDTGEYNLPVKAIVCSVGQKGTETVLGTFTTKGKYRWKALMGDVWGQYSTRIVGGILFHSVYYYEQGNPASLAWKEFNKLGSPASHGCIRMMVADAKWIYDNCPVGTTVIIYDDKKSPGPLGKPDTIKLPVAVRWDPTDPSKNNPFISMVPTITGAKNRTIEWGEEIDLMKGIKAKSSLGTDITKRLTIDGKVDKYSAGTYEITYSVLDALGRTCSKTVTITVQNNPEIPYFEGVSDRVVPNASMITRDDALFGVRAFLGTKLLKKKEIEVVFDKITKKEYMVTYNVYSGKDIIAYETATFYIDDEAPVLSGISDRVLAPGEIPDRDYTLREISITDNYSEMDLEDIEVTIEEGRGDYHSSSEAMGTTDSGLPKEEPATDSEPSEGDIYYIVTYKATDEVGNTAKKTVHFHY